MNLLLSWCCRILGHTPLVGRNGDDSVLVCERCSRVLGVFVGGLYAGQAERVRCVGRVRQQPEHPG